MSDLSDSGPGSLRQAVLDANATSGDDIITFSVAGTITLTTNLPWITDNVAVIGPGTNDLTIDGAGSYYAFYMSGGHTNWVSDLAVANTYARGSGQGQVHPETYMTNACGLRSDG